MTLWTAQVFDLTSACLGIKTKSHFSEKMCFTVFVCLYENVVIGPPSSLINPYQLSAWERSFLRGLIPLRIASWGFSIEDWKSIFFSSHIVSDLEEVCDDVVFLKEGKIVFDGSLQEVYANAVDTQFEAIVRTDKSIEGLEVEDLTPGLKRVVFANSQKEEMVKRFTQSDYELVKLNPLGKSLEEVFYFSNKEDKSWEEH